MFLRKVGTAEQEHLTLRASTNVNCWRHSHKACCRLQALVFYQPPISFAQRGELA